MKNRNLFFGIICLLAMQFSNLNAQNLTVEGTVGVGTSTPQSQLEVRDNQSSEFRLSLSNTNWAKFQYSDIEGLRIESKNTGIAFTPTLLVARELKFNTGAGTTPERMRLTENGDLGIGTVSPSEKVHITGNLKLEGDLKVGDTEIMRDGGNLRQGFNSTLVPTADNQHNVGASILRWNRIFAVNGTIQTSDLRDKTDIRGMTYGLKEVLAMRPVEYRWKEDRHDEKKLGFIAQELLEVIPEVVVTHEWRPNEEDPSEGKIVELERIGVYYSDIIPVLVSAIQEQNKVMEAKNTKIEALTVENAEIKDRLNRIEDLLQQQTSGMLPSTSTTVLTNARLEQNQPNPFNGSTVVRYFIPKDVKQAELLITDLSGKTIKNVRIEARGEGQTTFDATTLSSGNYQYSLLLDGRLIDTKKMVLARD